jgi:hypothetical protein
MQRGFVALAVALGVAFPDALDASQVPKEIPENVAIHDLLGESTRYDGRRVVVTGFVTSIAFEQGRRGSEYAVLVLTEAGIVDSSDTPEIKVISLTIPKVGHCQHALVQGIYHRAGKQAGRPYEFFIDAEAVIQSDIEGATRLPRECDQNL